ncbi:carbohydrate ABC transporter permease [Clostridium lacusfryxellense]|uniref:carbohydrate ABC transporter permease n=1 Tax=Clostridium lacusfryxellense TaxID=205328 RepID=UPI001C0DBE34|nr:carbohydrate ABC transporter permease [Clostridium lacusfryxellense]MBU3113411.1 carbohydrate ABC transporter permease [Clostridium lacusfryxellense]
MKLSKGEKVANGTIYTSLTILAFLTLYPFWNTLVISFNDGLNTTLGGITFWPRKFTIENYKAVLNDAMFIKALIVTIGRTVIGTFMAMFFTSIYAYGLSKKYLKGKKIYMIFSVITMYFSGGLIPIYLLIRSLGMINSYAALVVPSLVGVYNMIILRTFFMGIPEEIEESAKLDGCNHIRTFFSIILPISGPAMATISLFTAVYFWNEWFTAGIYINDAAKLPIQNYLMNVMNSSNYAEQMAKLTGGIGKFTISTVTSRSLQAATIMVATLPIVMVYPFVQKYFVKGVLVGSVKG